MNKAVPPEVRAGADLAGADGREVRLHGRYVAMERPVRGTRSPRPRDRAVLVLADGTEVWLEPLDQPASVRRAEELVTFDGVNVRAVGVAHKVMPARGQSPIDPCLSEVRDLTWEGP